MAFIKFLCSYAGRIVPRYPDGKLRYLGGETRVLSVDRSISFSELLSKLEELCGTPECILRCQLPTEDLDSLVSITSDEDLANVIEEYDRASPPPSSVKVRAFLSPPKPARKISPTPSSASTTSSATPPHTTTAGSSPRFSNPHTTAGSSPRFSNSTAAVDKSAAGKFHNRQCRYYQQEHHSYYAHGSPKSGHVYVVHDGNQWRKQSIAN